MSNKQFTESPAKFLSIFIERMVPDYVREDHPMFVTFMQKYFEYLERETDVNGELGEYKQISDLIQNVDIDHTLDQFIPEFEKQYLHNIPHEAIGAEVETTGKAFLAKNIKESYKEKGTVNALDFLFRREFNTSAQVSYPKEFMLKASGSIWYEPQWLEVSEPEEDVKKLYNKKVIGQISGATAFVDIEEFATMPEPEKLLLTQVEGSFVQGEEVWEDVGTSGAIPNKLTVISDGIIAPATCYINGVAWSTTYGPNVPQTKIACESLKETDNTIKTAVWLPNGYWVDSTGFLSSDRKMQDNDYYQDFSYVIRSDVPVQAYRDVLKKLVHPVGLKLFAEYMFESTVPMGTELPEKYAAYLIAIFSYLDVAVDIYPIGKCSDYQLTDERMCNDSGATWTRGQSYRTTHRKTYDWTRPETFELQEDVIIPWNHMRWDGTTREDLVNGVPQGSGQDEVVVSGTIINTTLPKGEERYRTKVWKCSEPTGNYSYGNDAELLAASTNCFAAGGEWAQHIAGSNYSDMTDEWIFVDDQWKPESIYSKEETQIGEEHEGFERFLDQGFEDYVLEILKKTEVRSEFTDPLDWNHPDDHLRLDVTTEPNLIGTRLHSKLYQVFTMNEDIKLGLDAFPEELVLAYYQQIKLLEVDEQVSLDNTLNIRRTLKGIKEYQTTNSVCSDPSITTYAECVDGGTCSDSTYNNDEYSCLNVGSCSSGANGLFTELLCEAAGFVWTAQAVANTWTASGNTWTHETVDWLGTYNEEFKATDGRMIGCEVWELLVAKGLESILEYDLRIVQVESYAPEQNYRFWEQNRENSIIQSIYGNTNDIIDAVHIDAFDVDGGIRTHTHGQVDGFAPMVDTVLTKGVDLPQMAVGASAFHTHAFDGTELKNLLVHGKSIDASGISYQQTRDLLNREAFEIPTFHGANLVCGGIMTPPLWGDWVDSQQDPRYNGYGECFNSQYDNIDDCISAYAGQSMFWMSPGCSDGTGYSQEGCEGGGGTWTTVSTSFCSDSSFEDESSCLSNNVNITTQLNPVLPTPNALDGTVMRAGEYYCTMNNDIPDAWVNQAGYVHGLCHGATNLGSETDGYNYFPYNESRCINVHGGIWEKMTPAICEAEHNEWYSRNDDLNSYGECSNAGIYSEDVCVAPGSCTNSTWTDKSTCIVDGVCYNDGDVVDLSHYNSWSGNYGLNSKEDACYAESGHCINYDLSPDGGTGAYFDYGYCISNPVDGFGTKNSSLWKTNNTWVAEEWQDPSVCSNPRSTDEISCIEDHYYESCSDDQFSDKDSCLAGNNTIVLKYCSDWSNWLTDPTAGKSETLFDCLVDNNIWSSSQCVTSSYGEQVWTDSWDKVDNMTDCLYDNNVWALGECSDNTITDEVLCVNATETWTSFGECSNTYFTTQEGCENSASGAVWTDYTSEVCKNHMGIRNETTESTCLDLNNVWNDSGCSDPQFIDQSSCIADNNWYMDSESQSNYSARICDGWTEAEHIAGGAGIPDCENDNNTWTSLLATEFCSDGNGSESYDECVSDNNVYTPHAVCWSPADNTIGLKDEYDSETTCLNHPINNIWDDETGLCSDPMKYDELNCLYGNTSWVILGTCSDASYDNITDCTDNGMSWTLPGTYTCSDGQYSDETSCVSAGEGWDNVPCTDRVSTNNLDCLGSNNRWSGPQCSFNIHEDYYSCTHHNNHWSPFDGGVCVDYLENELVGVVDSTECHSNNAQWLMNSRTCVGHQFAEESGCLSYNNEWNEESATCTNSEYSDEETCLENNTSWYSLIPSDTWTNGTPLGTWSIPGCTLDEDTCHTNEQSWGYFTLEALPPMKGHVSYFVKGEVVDRQRGRTADPLTREQARQLIDGDITSVTLYDNVGALDKEGHVTYDEFEITIGGTITNIHGQITSGHYHEYSVTYDADWETKQDWRGNDMTHGFVYTPIMTWLCFNYQPDLGVDPTAMGGMDFMGNPWPQNVFMEVPDSYVGGFLNNPDITLQHNQVWSEELNPNVDWVEIYSSNFIQDVPGSGNIDDLIGAQNLGTNTDIATIEAYPRLNGEWICLVDQSGYIYLKNTTTLVETLLLDLTSLQHVIGLGSFANYDERGVLGLAFHPDYSNNGKFYVYYMTEQGGGTGAWGFPLSTTVISEFVATFSGNFDESNVSTERILMEVPQPDFNHNGGELAFGPDGYLYIGLGDGGSAGDVSWATGHGGHGEYGNAQNPTNLLGNILRIDVDSTDGSVPYSIPADNPFINSIYKEGQAEAQPFRPEIYAYGFRNPWRFSFAPDGKLWCADVGQDKFEEINIIEKGGNYGWRVIEGYHEYEEDQAIIDQIAIDLGYTTTLAYLSDLKKPIHEYTHGTGISILGGFVYRGTLLPELTGKYIFGDWGENWAGTSGHLFTLEENTTGLAANFNVLPNPTNGATHSHTLTLSAAEVDLLQANPGTPVTTIQTDTTHAEFYVHTFTIIWSSADSLFHIIGQTSPEGHDVLEFVDWSDDIGYTRKSLSFWDPVSETVTLTTFDESILSMGEDTAGEIYFSTREGINTFQPPSGAGPNNSTIYKITNVYNSVDIPNAPAQIPASQTAHTHGYKVTYDFTEQMFDTVEISDIQMSPWDAFWPEWTTNDPASHVHPVITAWSHALDTQIPLGSSAGWYYNETTGEWGPYDIGADTAWAPPAVDTGGYVTIDVSPNLAVSIANEYGADGHFHYFDDVILDTFGANYGRRSNSLSQVAAEILANQEEGTVHTLYSSIVDDGVRRHYHGYDITYSYAQRTFVLEETAEWEEGVRDTGAYILVGTQTHEHPTSVDGLLTSVGWNGDPSFDAPDAVIGQANDWDNLNGSLIPHQHFFNGTSLDQIGPNSDRIASYLSNIQTTDLISGVIDNVTLYSSIYQNHYHEYDVTFDSLNSSLIIQETEQWVSSDNQQYFIRTPADHRHPVSVDGVPSGTGYNQIITAENLPLFNTPGFPYPGGSHPHAFDGTVVGPFSDGSIDYAVGLSTDEGYKLIDGIISQVIIFDSISGAHYHKYVVKWDDTNNIFYCTSSTTYVRGGIEDATQDPLKYYVSVILGPSEGLHWHNLTIEWNPNNEVVAQQSGGSVYQTNIASTYETLVNPPSVVVDVNTTVLNPVSTTYPDSPSAGDTTVVITHSNLTTTTTTTTTVTEVTETITTNFSDATSTATVLPPVITTDVDVVTTTLTIEDTLKRQTFVNDVLQANNPPTLWIGSTFIDGEGSHDHLLYEGCSLDTQGPYSGRMCEPIPLAQANQLVNAQDATYGLVWYDSPNGAQSHYHSYSLKFNPLQGADGTFNALPISQYDRFPGSGTNVHKFMLSGGFHTHTYFLTEAEYATLLGGGLIQTLQADAIHADLYTHTLVIRYVNSQYQIVSQTSNFDNHDVIIYQGLVAEGGQWIQSTAGNGLGDHIHTITVDESNIWPVPA